jgi:hypothetical protein
VVRIHPPQFRQQCRNKRASAVSPRLFLLETEESREGPDRSRDQIDVLQRVHDFLRVN